MSAEYRYPTQFTVINILVFCFQVEMNILALEPALLCGRTILVNPINNVKKKDMGISYENIDSLKRKYNLLILHGNIMVTILNLILHIITL